MKTKNKLYLLAVGAAALSLNISTGSGQVFSPADAVNNRAIAASPRAKEFEHRVGRVFLTVEAFPSFGDTFKNIAWAESLGLERARQVILYRAANVSVSGAPE